MGNIQRFSTRVTNYVRYRPGYPPQLITDLIQDYHLQPQSIVADVGAGTGLLAKLFLENNNVVYGVEPNREMREMGDQLLAGYPHFVSINGTAESTHLPPKSIDFIIVGQAFHWFDLTQTKEEFQRILNPKSGWVVLIWNSRKQDTNSFGGDYENMLQALVPEYTRVSHKKVSDDQSIRDFMGDYDLKSYPNQQLFDFESLMGRALSSSYTPDVGHPQHQAFLTQLRMLFDRHAINGQITFDYETRMYIGRLTP